MAHVITDDCLKCAACVEGCPSDAIHPRPGEPDFDLAPQLHIDAKACMDCGSCALACPTGAVFHGNRLPRAKVDAGRRNYVYFLKE